MASPATRMKAEDRRELVLRAATQVFGERGYVGATTAEVAKAAGVSQPYVVRIFGTKEALFLAVLQRALDRLLTAFRAVLADDTPVSAVGEEGVTHRLAIAYVDLLSDRGLLLSLMHGFILGSETEIGACARAGFLEVYRFLRREAGLSPEEIHGFLAEGMLLNTLVGLRMTVDYDDVDARELLETTMPTKLEFLLRLDSSR